VVGETADRGELTGDPFSPPSVSVACGNWRFYFGPPTVRFDRQGAHRKSVVHAETVIPGGTRRLLGSRAVSVPSLGSHRRLGTGHAGPPIGNIHHPKRTGHGIFRSDFYVSVKPCTVFHEPITAPFSEGAAATGDQRPGRRRPRIPPWGPAGTLTQRNTRRTARWSGYG
jgi:hypothetical protein